MCGFHTAPAEPALSIRRGMLDMAAILIVEDETHICRVLSMWLQRHDHTTFEAGNGVDGLAILKRESIDLIISDMNMPRMDGLELARVVREELELTIPFLMLSARCDQTKLATRVAPFQIVLYPKPFVPSRLVANIERMLTSPVA